MQNPYDVNANADRALMGGESADKAAGFYNPRPQAGMRTASNLIADAKAKLDAMRQPAQQAPQEPVFGFNPETQTFFSGGKTWSAGNLSEVDNYDKAGYFDLHNEQLPEGFAPVTGSHIRAWKEKKAADRGFWSATGETLSAVGRGIPDIANMGVKAAAMSVPKGLPGGEWLESQLGQAAAEYDRTATTPDVYGRGETAQSFIRAGQAIPASVAAGAASVAAPIIGTGGAGYVMGAAQAWDTYQKGLAAGLTPEAAKAAAIKTGSIEGIGETVADAAAARILPGAGKMVSGMMRGVAPAGYGKRVAIDLLANAGVQSGTEYGQAAAQAAVERDAGIRQADPHAEGMEGLKTGLAMSALMMPFGAVAGYANRPNPVPPAPAQPAAPAAAPTLPPTAQPGETGDLFGGAPSAAQPAAAQPESYRQLLLSMVDAQNALEQAESPEEAEFAKNALTQLAAQLAAMGDNTTGQRQTMSGVNEMVSGVPVELTNDELVSGNMPFVPTGFDPQASAFSLQQPSEQFGLPFEDVPVAPVEPQQSTPRKTKLSADELSYEGQPVTFSNADYVPQDTGAYSESKLAAAINPKNRLKKRMPPLVKALHAAVTKWDEKAIGAALAKIEKADPDIFMAADQLVERMRQERVNTLARQGQAQAQPGQTVGQLPVPKTDTVDQMRAQSQQTLADETQPDYTPNEMDPTLVKERQPKGPAATLALRPTTQAQLNEWNAREAAMQPQQQPAAESLGDGNPAQTQLFTRQGAPTNAATGQNAPVSQPAQPAAVAGKGAGVSQPTQAAPKRGPKSRRPAPKPVENTDVTANVEQADTTEVANNDLTANTPEELSPQQQRMMDMIDRAYESDQIDFGDIADLQQMVREGRVPAARAKLSELAIANKGDGRAKFRSEGASGAGMTVDAVRRIVKQVFGDWSQVNRVVVVASEANLPAPIREQMAKDGMSGKAVGAYRDGIVYVIADKAVNAKHVVETVLHELAGHHGLRGLLGNDMAKVMVQIYNTNPSVRAAADAKIAQGLDKATAVEEVLAEMQEARKDGKIIAIWERIVRAIKAAIKKNTGYEFSDHDVQALLDAALDYAAKGPEPGGKKTETGDTVYRTAKETLAPAKDYLKYDAIGAAKRAVLSSTFLRDLGERYKSKFARVTDFVDATFRMSAKQGAKQKIASDVSTKWQALSAKESAELSSFMGEVTELQVHIESDTKGLSKAEASARDALRERFNAMSDKQKDAYRASRDALKTDWQETAKLLAKKADDIYNPLIAKATAAGNVSQAKSLTSERNAFVADINGRLNTIRGDYFPLSRFGNWSYVERSPEFQALVEDAEAKEQALQDLVSKLDKHTADQRKAIRKANRNLPEESRIEDYTPEEKAQLDEARKAATEARAAVENAKTDEDMYYVAQFDSEGQAEAHKRDRGGNGYVSLRSDRNNKELSGVSRQMLDRLDQALETQLGSKGLSSSAREAQRSLYQIYLSSLPETSALKRQMKRKTIAGYNKDMHRNVVSTLFRNSFYLSRMEHADDITSALNSVRQEANEAAKRAPAGKDLQRVAAELERRHVASMNYVDTPIQDKVTAISYLWFLGASPAFLITNLLQPGMVTMPMLASRHGAASAGAMASAYKLTFKALTQSFKKAKEFTVEDSGLSDAHKALMTYLMENRLLDVTMAHDLATISEGGTTSKWVRRLSNPSHYAELVNRISSGIAAYELEYRKTGDSAAAQKYAAKVLADTHLDYSQENAPYWMKPGVVPLGKVLFQFKKYQLGMLSLMAKNIAALTRKEDRKEAMGMLAGVAITHLAMAGSMGLPAAATVTLITQMVASAFDDEPRNVEAEYRNWLNRTFGKDAGTALAKGLPAMLGVDMSQKVGLGSIARPASVRDSDTKQGRDLYLEVLAAMAGPSIGGLASRPFEFYDYAANGEMGRAASSLLPKMVGDAFKGARYAAEGASTRQGRVLSEPGGVPLVALMAMGFPLTHVVDAYAANAAKQGLKAALDDMVGDVKREWLKGDGKERALVQRNLPELNKLRAQYGLRPITMGDMFRFQQQMKRPSVRSEQINAIGEFAEE